MNIFLTKFIASSQLLTVGQSVCVPKGKNIDAISLDAENEDSDSDIETVARMRRAAE